MAETLGDSPDITDRSGIVFGVAMLIVLALSVSGVMATVYAVTSQANDAQARRCQTVVLQGEVRRLDWSGGWRSGVLIELDTGSHVVSGRGTLPAVGDRVYVCENNHAHQGSPPR